ncbi:hypothetical protein GP486_002907 [Trichoglossum hirsutum]|uniref:Uncharacterized protein n=1 Tax=Trichoglossum hirsutum TaxID=265104 RepID=A0A9P8LEB7_9PEZI|nr:hypothetical protein GP486_002907 [Trichoglossum hirsutum]
MAHSSLFASPLPGQLPSSNPSDERRHNSTRGARRSASTPLQSSIDLQNFEDGTQIVPPVSLIVTNPDGDEFTSQDELGISRLVPRQLHTGPSSTVLGQRSSTSSWTTRSLTELTRRSTADMSLTSHDPHSPPAFKPFYNPSAVPLLVSQQTSASSSRDLGLRKKHHGGAKTQEFDPTSPSPSVTSFRLPEEGLLSGSKFYRKRPPQLDLSLLFPKPQPSTRGLLSPDKLVHSPVQLSPASETSPSKDVRDDARRGSGPLRKTPSRESVKSRDYPLEGPQSPGQNLRKGTAQWDLQGLQHLLKRKATADEAVEEDFVQRLAQNIQDQRPKAPKALKPLDNGGDRARYQNQSRKRSGANGEPAQGRVPPAPGPASRKGGSVRRSNPNALDQKTTISKKADSMEEYVRRRTASSLGPTGRNSDSIRPSSSSGSGQRTITSKRSSGSVFSRSDLREQSVLESSSSEDEGDIFGSPLGVEDEGTEDNFIFQGKLEKVPWRSAASSSSRSSYFTARAEQMSKGSQKSNRKATPKKTTRNCVSFLRPEEPQDDTGGSQRSASAPTRLRSWLMEMTPPPSPELSSNTGSALTMAVSQEEKDLLKAMREKRFMLLGRLRTDLSADSSHSTQSPESSIWLPLERNNSPVRKGQRLSGSKSSPVLRNEYFVDRYSSVLLSPSETSRRIRRAPSFVQTNFLPSPPSSEPSPTTPPMNQTMPRQIANYLLSPSTSPSSTLHERGYFSKPGSKATNDTFLDPGTPATPLLERSGRTPMTERIVNRLISASTSSSSMRGSSMRGSSMRGSSMRGKYPGGGTASFDRLVSEDEDDFHTAEGLTFSSLSGRASHTAPS